MSKTHPSDDSARTSAHFDEEVEGQMAAAFGNQSAEELMAQGLDTVALDNGGIRNPESKVEELQFEYELKRGRISGIRGDDVFVDLAGVDGKLQGIVPLKQFDRSPRIGCVMDFVVQQIDEAEGLIHLSREGAVSQVTWQQLQRGSLVEARVVDTNKGGLEMEMLGGIRAFMPASQIELHLVKELESYVGQKLCGVVRDIDRRSRKIVLSRRYHLEHERRVKCEKLLEELEVGQMRTGVVAKVVDFGAFVDLGGLDGLVHISDMSYGRIEKSSDAVNVGERITVKVLEIDNEHKRIRLGLKQAGPDPWENIEERLQVGQQICGRVLRTVDFGAFVEIEPGVEALLPAGEVSWKRISRPANVLKEGEVLNLVVLQMDGPKQRLLVSLKQAQRDPWSDVTTKYSQNSVVEATVVSTTDYGAFVELEPDVEGLVHISELADRHVKNVDEVVQVGHKYQFRILEIRSEMRRIKLSLKAVENLPELKATAPDGRASESRSAKRRKRDSSLKGGLNAGGGMGQGLGDLKL